MRRSMPGLGSVSAALAVLLLGAGVAVADPLPFLSEANLSLVSSHGHDAVREGAGEASSPSRISRSMSVRVCSCNALNRWSCSSPR